MILLDTNVVSEVMRPQPDERVMLWLNEADPGSIFLSAVSIGEIRYGLAVLPSGQKRRKLQQRFEKFVALGFAERMPAFDERAAGHYGEIMARCRRLGRPIGVADGQIAAIATAEGFALATRNTRDFDDCGIELINPFVD
jgi:predicted nucleic acid-binding protein